MRKPSPEGALVHRICSKFDVFRTSGVRLGTGDDAALWQPRQGYETILTSDWFLEGSHFLRAKHPPNSVGWKCLARATSDIAAMGGAPRCFLLNLALPQSQTGKWLDGFLVGLKRASNHLQCAMVGGDTTKSDRILICMTVIGEVRCGQAIPRSEARPGELLYVSGRLGEAELGLRLLKAAKGVTQRQKKELQKHLYPEPRIALGQWLAEHRLATSMMDLSDGLSLDLASLCEASRVGAQIEEASLPIPFGVRQQLGVQLALHGGDDYELLFAVTEQNAGKLPSSFNGLPITCIGRTTKTKRVLARRPNGRNTTLIPGGWDPFRK